MAGRGGRGAALESLLKDEGARRPGSEETPVRAPGGRGAALLAQIQQHQEQQTQSVTSVTPPVGGGRGALLRASSGVSQESAPERPAGRGALLQAVATGRGAALAQTLSEDVSKPGSVVSDSTSLKSGTVSEIAAVTSAMEQTAISSSSPVSKSPTSSGEPVYYRGTEGKEIRVTVNYMRLEIEEHKGIFEYEVRFDPPIDHNQVRYKCLKQLEDVIGSTRTFDGVVLYLPIKLSEPILNLPCQNPNDQSRVTCIIKYKKTHKLKECVHFYNVLFNKILHKLGLVRFGRNFYSPTMKHEVLQHGLEIWPGYVTAVDEYEDGLFLNLDVSHRVLRTTTVYAVMKECIQSYRDEWKNKFVQEIIGNSVITRYNNNVYKIDDVNFDITPRSTFPRHDGSEMSYLQYYKQQYEIDIKDANQPMLIHRKKKRDLQRGDHEQLVCLVPELCCLTGLSDGQRNNFTLMKDLAQYTKPSPVQRQRGYETYLKNVRENESALSLIRNWGLKLPTATVTLHGRTLDPEAIFFGNNQSIRGSYNADWNREVTNQPVLMPMRMENWAIVYTQRDERAVKTFEEHMFKSTRQMGITVNKPQYCMLNNEGTQSYVNELRRIIKPPLQIVVIIFPSLRADRYAAVKKICCSEMPIASQVINGKTISRPDKARSIVQKIALQMNAKMGGSLWAVKIPTTANTKIMICGMDTYHEGAQKSSSVSAFVASMNDEFTRWYSRVAIQNKGQEIIDELKSMFASSLKNFHRVNGKFPDRIIIYRDGVGDGQMKLIRDYEIEQIESVFKVISPDYYPKFTFIIVQKRINTRVFLQSGKGLDNPSPGTIVDHTVTRKYFRDFFLVPQLVRQGTVSPTHYVILYDSDNSLLKPQMAQKITYKLCHLYYNWPGTIRVPAPCQYAHKLAYLIGQSVKKPHHDVLSDKLFYL